MKNVLSILAVSLIVVSSAAAQASNSNQSLTNLKDKQGLSLNFQPSITSDEVVFEYKPNNRDVIVYEYKPKNAEPIVFEYFPTLDQVIVFEYKPISGEPIVFEYRPLHNATHDIMVTSYRVKTAIENLDVRVLRRDNDGRIYEVKFEATQVNEFKNSDHLKK